MIAAPLTPQALAEPVREAAMKLGAGEYCESVALAREKRLQTGRAA